MLPSAPHMSQREGNPAFGAGGGCLRWRARAQNEILARGPGCEGGDHCVEGVVAALAQQVRVAEVEPRRSAQHLVDELA